MLSIIPSERLHGREMRINGTASIKFHLFIGGYLLALAGAVALFATGLVLNDRNLRVDLFQASFLAVPAITTLLAGIILMIKAKFRK